MPGLRKPIMKSLLVSKLIWPTSWRYFLILVTSASYVTSQTAPHWGEFFQDACDLVLLLDISSNVTNDTFNDYKTLLNCLLANPINHTSFEVVLFDETTSVHAENITGEAETGVASFYDIVQQYKTGLTNSTESGIIAATQTAWDLLKIANVTCSAMIWYVTTGYHGNYSELSSILDKMSNESSRGLTVSAFGIENFNESNLERLIKGSNRTMEVGSLKELLKKLSCVTAPGMNVTKAPGKNVTKEPLFVFFVLINCLLFTTLLVFVIMAFIRQPNVLHKVMSEDDRRPNLEARPLPGPPRQEEIPLDSRPLPTPPADEDSKPLPSTSISDADSSRLVNRPLPRLPASDPVHDNLSSQDFGLNSRPLPSTSISDADSSRLVNRPLPRPPQESGLPKTPFPGSGRRFKDPVPSPPSSVAAVDQRRLAKPEPYYNNSSTYFKEFKADAARNVNRIKRASRRIISMFFDDE